MSKPNIMNLPADYALVLQQIRDDGEDDIISLSESLNLKQSRIKHIVKALKGKGLLLMKTSYGNVWLQLTRKGERMATYIWPERLYVS